MANQTGNFYRFLLLGKTGSGKSTTGNTILGGKYFTTDISFGSVTNSCALQRNTRNGTTYEIMDSPGLFDTYKSQEEIASIMVQALACMHPGPDALLYVVMLGNRYTEEEFSVYNRLKALLDEQVTKHMIIIFSHGDVLDREGKRIEDVLKTVPEQMKQVLQECGNRYVVFNNLADDKSQQVLQLLMKVRRVQHQNGGRPYNCPKYSEVGAKMEEEISRRLAVVEKRELQTKKYVKELQEKSTKAELEAKQAKQEFERREKERERRAREEDLKREKMTRDMLDTLQKQQASYEQQRQAEMEMRKEQERERRREQEQYERQRREELDRIMRCNDEAQRLMMQRMEEERKQHQQQMERYQREMSSLKDQVAKRDSSFCIVQ